MKNLSSLLLLGAIPAAVFAQSQVSVDKERLIKQPVTPQYIQNYFFVNGVKTYNLRGNEMGSFAYPIKDMAVNEVTHFYALVLDNGKKSRVELSEFNVDYPETAKIKNLKTASAVCYTTDTKMLVVADGRGNVIFYDTKTYKEQFRVEIPVCPIKRLTVSQNGYFVAAIAQDKVYIINQENKNIRTVVPVENAIEAKFDQETSHLGIVTSDAMRVYNTIDFGLANTFAGFGELVSFDFHPEGKYVTFVNTENDIVFASMVREDDKSSIKEENGSIIQLFYSKTKTTNYVVYTGKNYFKTITVNGLEPNYTKIMREELNQRLQYWSKRLPGESDEEFNARVNEENQQKEKKRLAREISTELADGVVKLPKATLGAYNRSNGTLTLDMPGRKPVYLKVPMEESLDFMSADDLEFSDMEYMLTPDDQFELVYAMVTNKKSGKSYEYDNREMQTLDFLKTDDEYVPLELIQKAAREEIALQGIRKKVMEAAKEQNLISDHTHITVSTKMVSDVDANGNRINNYKIDCDYTVEAEYSATEDFKPGKYQIEQSNAAISMLKIITEAFERDFAEYIKPGKKLTIDLTGSADSSPIGSKIAYNECYGVIENEPFYLDGEIKPITITKSSGITKNEQLAYLRAQGVRAYLTENLKSINEMETKYITHVELPEGKGSEFRRIHVTFTFIDAL